MLPLFLCAGMAYVPVFAQTPDAPLKLNQIQVIGTHNSYHAGIAPSEAKLWQTQPQYAEAYKGLDYQHKPLPEQFDSGVRQIELDIYADSKGGRYADPAGPKRVAAAGLPADPPFDPDGLMKKPGFKVMHVQDVDYRSTCQPFTGCLKQIRTWSHAHPEHMPIFILVETKQGSSGKLKLTEPEPFTTATFDALDAEIRSVFPADEMVTPDDVRGHYATLNEAVLAGNWPTLASARGKVVFLLDQRNVTQVYLEGHPSLRGRVLFTNSVPGEADAAFTERNDGPADEITALVKQGYLVRARTDSDTKEARVDDTAHRDAMMASGAQLLSTDYPASEPARWAGHYEVALPGSVVARCDPANTPAGCTIDNAK
nr:phosphatidylinositol-specific phospholipase C1-like protein [Granulicella sp. 5B5]